MAAAVAMQPGPEAPPAAQHDAGQPATIELPGAPTAAWVARLKEGLLQSTWQDSLGATAEFLPAQVMASIISKATSLLKREATLLELTPSSAQQRVTVVGDTHGHFHDVCHLFDRFGSPSPDRIFIFNGDYVDRGAWGVEEIVLLLAYKWLLPDNVVLLRGNHESSFCTEVYGFKSELMAKYGSAGKGLYTELKQLFAALPLAALVERNTLIMHGGLFLAPTPRPRGAGASRAPQQPLARLGTLDDLRAASKGGPNPDHERSMKQLIAEHILWSDPSSRAGHIPNEQRGVGTCFGADVTEAFLAANKLKLIIRSHEGPDARAKRPSDDIMPSVDSGYAVDHDTPSGKLVTLFSAPCYPQFMAAGDAPFNNKGAVLHLSGPDYATPEVESFDAVQPRPNAVQYYDPNPLSDCITTNGSSDDEEPGSSTMSHGLSPPAAANALGTPASEVHSPAQRPKRARTGRTGG